MKVLVSVASRYGATAEIADAIAEVLRERGGEVTTGGPEGLGAAQTGRS